jgi:hypothetical protein
MSGLDWLSWFLDYCPGVGEVKAVLELIIGKDLLTLESLNAFDRATSAISIIPVAGWLAKIPKGSKAAKNILKFERFLNLVNKASKANDALDKINLMRLVFSIPDGPDDPDKPKKFNVALFAARAFFPVKEGKYIVHSSIHYKYVWDVDINSSNLHLWERHGGLNQQFFFKPILAGYYTIYCVQNGKALDCAYSSKDNGANAWVYEFNDTSAQHWNIKGEIPEESCFPIIITCYTQIDYSTTKRCIDLKNSNVQNGTNIWLYKENGTNAQVWLLERVD